jgi:transmembrane E3 ubiquitin-protein ligase
MANDARQVILVIILFYLIFSGDVQPPASRLHISEDEILAREWHSVNVLNSTRYGDFSPREGRWLNLTGMREEDGYSWDLWEACRDKAREQADYALNTHLEESQSQYPLYHNITGIVHGDWVMSKLKDDFRHPQLNLSWTAPPNTYHHQNEFDRNLTSLTGSTHFRFHDSKDVFSSGNVTVRSMVASMNIREDSSVGHWWELTMHGLHFVETGRLLLTTTSEK